MVFCLYGVGMELNTITHLTDKSKLSKNCDQNNNNP